MEEEEKEKRETAEGGVLEKDQHKESDGVVVCESSESAGEPGRATRDVQAHFWSTSSIIDGLRGVLIDVCGYGVHQVFSK